jgi:peptide/nickel transport system substrate-binding protein
MAVNYAIDRDSLVEIAESGAGSLAFHQFTPYAWWDPFEEALQPLYQKYSIDASAHLDKADELMTGKGYAKDGDFWTDASGEKLEMNIFVPDWLKQWGAPLVQQLRDAGYDAEFDLSPGLGSLVQTGEQAVYFHCKGPAGVKGMDPQFMLGIYTSQYYRPTGEPAPIWWATSRYRNPEYDAIVDKMFLLSPEDAETKDLLVEAMDIWFRDMPDIYVGQLIIRHMGNEEYWTGWPTKDNNYGFLHPWQQEFMKTIVNLKATK